MATPYSTKVLEKFAARVMTHYYEEGVSDYITNQNYEGEIKGQGSVLNILDFSKIARRVFTGSNMSTPDVINENNGQLVTDQKSAFYFNVPSLEKFESWIDDPESGLIKQCEDALTEEIDGYNLGLYTDVAAGQRDGTVYNTGTVTVANSTGVVTPAGGATFSAAMEGKGFKAAGHSKWYRVKVGSYAAQGNGNIVIENDEDDVASSYDGGAIAGGATYEIQANTAVQVSKTTIYSALIRLQTFLDNAKIPQSDRWCVLPPDLANLFEVSSEIVGANGTPEFYNEVAKRGYIRQLAGFTLFKNTQVKGDGTNGFHVLGGHKSAICHAMGFVENGTEDPAGNFGVNYKGLNVYGSKVKDIRRKALVEGFWKL